MSSLPKEPAELCNKLVGTQELALVSEFFHRVIAFFSLSTFTIALVSLLILIWSEALCPVDLALLVRLCRSALGPLVLGVAGGWRPAAPSCANLKGPFQLALGCLLSFLKAPGSGAGAHNSLLATPPPIFLKLSLLPHLHARV